MPAVVENLTECRVVGKQDSTITTWIKIDPDLQFTVVVKIYRKNSDRDRYFGGVVTSSFFGMTSYPNIFRKCTSADPISVKIGTIFHFHDKVHRKKSRTIPEFLTSLWRHQNRRIWRHPQISNIVIFWHICTILRKVILGKFLVANEKYNFHGSFLLLGRIVRL